MAISDAALNPLAGASIATMLGWVEPPASAEELQLDMYNFLIEPIRQKDLNEGALFVQRLLTGSQTLWRADQSRIFSIKDLWSVTDCPDDFLQYLKRIVGWTKDLDGITEGLDDATLRRLIAATVPLWKSRSTEDSVANVLNLVTGNRSQVWNWFDYRWILDETALEEERQGRDSWLISMPGTGEDIYWSTIRIVDPGEDGRALVKDVANLMRPTGERYEIVYLKFLERFLVSGDLSQWYVPDPLQTAGAVLPTVEGGVAKFDEAGTHAMLVNTDGAEDWEDRALYARMKGTDDTNFKGFGIVGMVDVDTGNGYGCHLDLELNAVVLDVYNAWVSTGYDTFYFSSIGMQLLQNVWYGLRMQISQEGTGLRMKVYVDGQEYLNDLRAAPVVTQGVPGIGKDCLTAECSDFEVMGLPAETETVEINY